MYSRGKLLEGLKRYPEAIDLLTDVYENGDSVGRRAAAYHTLGVIDVELGKWDEAEKKFKECLILRGEDKLDRRRAYEFRGLGQVYAFKKRLGKSFR